MPAAIWVAESQAAIYYEENGMKYAPDPRVKNITIIRLRK